MLGTSQSRVRSCHSYRYFLTFGAELLFCCCDLEHHPTSFHSVPRIVPIDVLIENPVRVEQSADSVEAFSAVDRWIVVLT